MVGWVKTTIHIADPILTEAKRLAAERGTTLRAVVEDALRRLLSSQRRPRRRFRLEDGSFKGDGLQPGLSWGDWDTIRAILYEGRGA